MFNIILYKINHTSFCRDDPCCEQQLAVWLQTEWVGGWGNVKC